MNKKFIIMIFSIVFMCIPSVVKAEDIECKYVLNDNGNMVELVITYNDEKETLDYICTSDDSRINQNTPWINFDYNSFKDKIDKNSSKNECPYRIVGYVTSFHLDVLFVPIFGTYNYDLYMDYNDVKLPWSVIHKAYFNKKITFVCENCSDGLGNMVIFDPEEYTTCEGILGTRLVNFINTIFNYVKVLVPVALIALGSFDIGRAVFAGNEDEMKKATKTFIRRLIIAVIIMFSPLLVNFIINVVNNATGTGYSGTCGIN